MSESIAMVMVGALVICAALLTALLAATRRCATHLQDILIFQRQSESRQQNQDEKFNESILSAITQVVDLQQCTVAQLHKIAIHYAPYLRTRADALHEKDHEENVQHDLDVDSIIRKEEMATQAKASATAEDWSWVTDVTPKRTQNIVNP